MAPRNEANGLRLRRFVLGREKDREQRRAAVASAERGLERARVESAEADRCVKAAERALWMHDYSDKLEMEELSRALEHARQEAARSVHALYQAEAEVADAVTSLNVVERELRTLERHEARASQLALRRIEPFEQVDTGTFGLARAK